MIVEATFVGKDGSMGYRTNRDYRLKVDGNRVRDIDHTGLTTPYESLEAFFSNWVDVSPLYSEEVAQPVLESELSGKKRFFLSNV